MARSLVVDLSKSSSADDVYTALFAAWGAPTWHRKNFNALRDSLIAGNINRIEPPFTLKFRGLATAGPEAAAFAREVEVLLGEMAAELTSAGRTITVAVGK